MIKPHRSSAPDPSDPQVLRRTDWLSGADALVLARLAPLRWDLKRDEQAMREALKRAIEGHRPVVVAALIDAGVPVNLPLLDSHREVSALRTALVQRNPDLVRVLLERGARLNEAEATAKPAALWLLAGKVQGKTGSPERKRAREAQTLDLLVDHGLAQRPDPVVQQRLLKVHGGSSVKVLDTAIDHGLVTVTPGEAPVLLGMTLANGQLALAQRLIGHGMRPRADRPEDLDDLVLQAVQHTPRDRDTPERWQHRALTLLEPLAALGPSHDLPAALDRLLARPLPPTPPVEGLPDTPRADRPAMDAIPVLRLAVAGAWPQRWWAALQAVDRPGLDALLEVEDGACARWVDDHNRTALHVLMQALHPVGPLNGPLERGMDRDGGVERHASTLTGAQHAALPGVVQRLLDLGVSPLWGSGGMGTPGTDQPSGALWSALDLPGPLGETLARTMIEALDATARAPLLARAVHDGRSRLTLDRLVAAGVPLDGLWEGLSALHLAVKAPQRHDRLAVLLAHGVPAGTRSTQGDTPRDLVHALWTRYQDGMQGENFRDQVQQLDVATLEQAVQESLPAGHVPAPRARSRL